MKYELNNIYNEDSYISVKNFEDRSVDCIYIDIPYLFTLGGQSKSDIGKRISNVLNSLSDISNGIDYSIFDEFKRIMKEVNIFIWCSQLQIKSILDYWLKFNNVKFDLFVWCKTNAIPNDNLLNNVEYCLWFHERKTKGDYYNKSKFFVSTTNKTDKEVFKHPTIKPLQFVKNHILCGTNENDLVVDFFSGSGTTAVACKESNRKFICFEKRKDYFENSIKRLKNQSIITEHESYAQLTLF